VRPKIRKTEPDYPSIDQRSAEQQAELEAYLSDESDERPEWIEYPKDDERYYFGPEILKPEEKSRLIRREGAFIGADGKEVDV